MYVGDTTLIVGYICRRFFGAKNGGIGISVGYSFEPKGLLIAPKTLANFLDRMTQLYEQGATVRRIGLYVQII